MIIKCKMCGGDLVFQPGDTYGKCDSCDSVCTIPTVQDEQELNRYNRANHFRRQCDFDKAVAAYEKILEGNEGDAEAHWGIVLSRFGIEYVEDPATGRRVPTCHRLQVSSVLTDADYLAALENAPDNHSRELYEQQAHEIAAIQKGILAISRNEQPFDVFICYKETDAAGQRTRDSQLAQDIYYALTDEGYRVFFSRITLEDKLGQQYEPYIFAALQSARVMLVVGTRPEHFSAVWVKNEWSRYLHIMKNDRSRLLIPCYRDMDPYDLPEEMSSLQSQDMGRIGFVQDLLRGIKKVLKTEEKPAAPVQQVVVQQAPAEGAGNISALLDRAFMALEDGEFGAAVDFCEQVLNQDARNARAYLGKLMAGLRVRLPEQLGQQTKSFDQDSNYQKIMRFGDDALKKQLQEWLQQAKILNELHIRTQKMNELVKRIEKAEDSEETEQIRLELTSFMDIEGVQEALKACDERKEHIFSGRYHTAKQMMANGKWSKARNEFSKIIDYRDSKEMLQICYFDQATQIMECAKTEEDFRHAAFLFEKIADYPNADELRAECIRLADEEAIQKQKKEEHMQVLSNRAKAMKGILVVSPNQEKPLHVGLDVRGNVHVSSECPGLRNIEHWKNLTAVSIGEYHALGLKADGTVVAEGSNEYGQLNVKDWHDIEHISAGGCFSVGLKKNGTAVAAGYNKVGQCDVIRDRWQNIVKIAAATIHVVALKNDGTVLATGFNKRRECMVDGWTDVVDIFARNSYTVGLKKDGTVLCTHRKIDVSGWKNVIDIALGCTTVMGLCKDGTVLMADMDKDFEKNYSTSQWHDIVAVSTHNAHMVGLKADGTVVATGYNGQKQCDVQEWRDIVYVSAGEFTTIGIKEDGTVLVAGQDPHQPYTGMASWNRLFGNVNTYLDERDMNIFQRQRWIRQGLCQYCGGEFKNGLFSAKCRACGRTKDY